MIAKHETPVERGDVWTRIAAPLPASSISWRQDGRPVSRDGKHFARFVCYVEANTVRERLDGVVPGEWDLHLDLLPPIPNADGIEDGSVCSFKARLQVLGVIREDVGTGRDYKSAATDAFKRAAVRYGIGHELYSMEQNWVQVDGDGKYAKPLEDPAVAYARRHGNGKPPVAAQATAPITREEVERKLDAEEVPTQSAEEGPSCPKCGSRMWDNRLTKKNPKAPDYKCRDRSCDGVIWPPKPGDKKKQEAPVPDYGDDGYPPPNEDFLPF